MEVIANHTCGGATAGATTSAHAAARPTTLVEIYFLRAACTTWVVSPHAWVLLLLQQCPETVCSLAAWVQQATHHESIQAN